MLAECACEGGFAAADETGKDDEVLLLVAGAVRDSGRWKWLDWRRGLRKRVQRGQRRALWRLVGCEDRRRLHGSGVADSIVL